MSIEKLGEALADRYEIEGELGSGGMATVYLAADKQLPRQVALKVLRPEVAHAVGADRFLNEIQTVAQLQHARILQLHDSGSAAGHLFYVMPYIRGESLRQKVDREHQLQLDDALRITHGVGEALAYAHREGVIHRDIKPPNIMLQDGQPILADFGIAYAVQQAGGARLTDTGLGIGTPPYMSPEQATADREPGPESDVWSLACVLYEMLTGELPFKGSTAPAILSNIILRDPTPPTELRRSTPLHVEEAVLKALEKVPGDRFPTVTDFLQALDDPGFRRTPREHPRLPGWLVPAVATVVGVVIGVITIMSSDRLRRPAAVGPAPALRTAIQLPADAPLTFTGPRDTWQSSLALSPDGRWLAYSAWKDSVPLLHTRDMSTGEIWSIDGSYGAYGPAFSPTADRIAFFVGDELRVVDTEGGRPRAIGEYVQPAGVAWLGGDRLMVANAHGWDPILVDAIGGNERHVVVEGPPEISVQNPSALPGNEWVVGNSETGRLVLFSVVDAEWYALGTGGVQEPDDLSIAESIAGTDPQWVPSGHVVYMGDHDLGLMAVPFDGARREVLGPPASVQGGIRREGALNAWGHFGVSHGGLLAYAPGVNAGLYHLARYDVETSQIDTLTFGRDAFGLLRASPDGSRLMVARRPADGGPLEAWILNLVSGQEELVEVGDGFNTAGWAWYPDSDRVLVSITDPMTFQPVRCEIYSSSRRVAEPFGQETCANAAINPVDTVVVAHGRPPAYRMQVTDARGGSIEHPFEGPIGHFSFSRDGTWMAFGQEYRAFVGPYPWTGARYQVSQAGVGHFGTWAPDEETVYFYASEALWSVDFDRDSLMRTSPRRLDVAIGKPTAWPYDVLPDGDLVVAVGPPERRVDHLVVVSNFFTVLTERAPAGR